MRILITALLLFFLSGIASAQQTILKGKVVDTLGHKVLTNAVVSLVHKKDSTLLQFTRTDQTGHFQLTKLTPGNYLLLITYPGFADYLEDIQVKDQPETESGSIPLTPKTRLLENIVIRNAGAIRIKGDTTEFVADSFKVREGATVEDLLKIIPGFQVNSKGQITAHGRQVQKVLVDGEEFFGDDPTMATQNISARAVDKVQVYDNKTDQDQIKGISTGSEGKTVNIKLKEDQKKGAFGKANLGTNFNDLMDSKALYNRFVGKKKIAVYGSKSTVNTGSLDWQDRQKLGMEDDSEYDEVSGFYYSFGSSDDFDNWSLRGLPDAYSAGSQYSNKWNSDRNNFNLSYRYNRLGTVNDASTLTQNKLDSSVSYTNNYQQTQGLNQQHNISGKYEWKIDSLNSLNLLRRPSTKKLDLMPIYAVSFLRKTKAG
jgi:hypothetical protein